MGHPREDPMSPAPPAAARPADASRRIARQNLKPNIYRKLKSFYLRDFKRYIGIRKFFAILIASLAGCLVGTLAIPIRRSAAELSTAVFLHDVARYLCATLPIFASLLWDAYAGGRRMRGALGGIRWQWQAWRRAPSSWPRLRLLVTFAITTLPLSGFLRGLAMWVSARTDRSATVAEPPTDGQMLAALAGAVLVGVATGLVALFQRAQAAPWPVPAPGPPGPSDAKPLAQPADQWWIPGDQPQRVHEQERGYLKERRRHLEQPPTLEPQPPESLPRLGLSLSGGGIRSATLCVGFLRRLALKNDGEASVLQLFDYLSTVSGGGWAGAAYVARLAQPPPRDAPSPPLTSEDAWRTLTDRLRRRGDYLVPGGVGLRPSTLRPLVLMAVGAVLNLLPLIGLGLAVIWWLGFFSSDAGFLRVLLEWLVGLLRANAPGLAGFLFADAAPIVLADIDTSERILSALYLLNYIGIACVLMLLGTGLLVAGMALCALTHQTTGYRIASRWASRTVLAAFVTGGVQLALRGSPGLTIGLCALGVLVAGYLLWRLRGALGPLLLAALIAAVALFAASRDASFTDVLGAVLDAVTDGWYRPLRWLLLSSLELSRGSGPTLLIASGVLGVGSLFLGLLIRRNQTSLIEFWGDRIRFAYLDVDDEESEIGSWTLQMMRPRAETLAPLHIINAAVNTPGSDDDRLRKRGTARFEITPYCVGGPATGWRSTRDYRNTLTFSRALAISAAAVNSQGGRLIPRWARVLLALVNCSLGYWLRNPQLPETDPRARSWGHFWSRYVVREMLAKNTERDPVLFVSDGGHHDNLGLTALVERGCELIVCVDAAADPGWKFPDLTRAAELLRIDSDWEVRLDVSAARPGPDGLSPSPVLVGELVRRGGGHRPKLIYVKAGIGPQAPFIVQRYRERYPRFPQQSTADQFFDESQLEAYAVLGEYLGDLALEQIKLALLPGPGSCPCPPHVTESPTGPGVPAVPSST